ncbi:MAG TPA: hypothetical protein VJ486_04895, partial [Geothrix sp.]|nr:hypothetical protein [Geothrix sp.]
TFSPDVTQDLAYGSGFTYNQATGVSTPAAVTTLVSSPISAACYSCHDTLLAKTHMELNNGSLYAPRSSVGTVDNTVPTAPVFVSFNKPETCLICHGAGTIADIKVVHK